MLPVLYPVVPLDACSLQMDEIRIWLELVDLALSRAQISQKRAALEQGISLEQWYQQRSAQGHVSLFRLFRLPGAFWREFIPILAEHFGIALPTPTLVRALQRLVNPRASRSTSRPSPTTARQGRLF
jgi:hypothetical protein